MTPDFYNQKLIDLQKEYDKSKFELAKEYALSNNPYQIGQKVTDHIGTVLIEKISIASQFYGLPCCTYFGFEINKDGSINKRQNKRNIWQHNIIQK